MNKIKCPKCGEVFTIDEADYASILQQVKNSEFEKELKNREAEIVKNSKISFELEKEKEGKAAERKIAELEAGRIGVKESEQADLFMLMQDSITHDFRYAHLALLMCSQNRKDHKDDTEHQHYDQGSVTLFFFHFTFLKKLQTKNRQGYYITPARFFK